MAIDQIWKQQLTLVTYGNEYLEGNLNFRRWVEHPIFNQNRLIFRDLLSQHLLAQHFQIWLEGLKKQDDCKNWSQFYEGKLADPWGNPYVYEINGSDYVLKSLGKDKKEGGSGFDKDIVWGEEEEEAPAKN